MVYVDNSFIQYGRMQMSHLVADSTNELLDMATKIGIQLKWIQHPGTYREHFDICKSKRELAIENGAIAISCKELGKILINKRKTFPDSQIARTAAC